MPQESPFQEAFPDFSPYCQTRAIAVTLLNKVLVSHFI